MLEWQAIWEIILGKVFIYGVLVGMCLTMACYVFVALTHGADDGPSGFRHFRLKRDADHPAANEQKGGG
jgi:hypothetical protein